MSNNYETIDLQEGTGDLSGPAALLVTDHYPADPQRTKYFDTLSEIQGDLAVGEVKVFGKIYKERRETCFYCLTNSSMDYSGRTLLPKAPVEGGIVDTLFQTINSSEFRKKFSTMIPGHPIQMPDFNAVFINWYRPPSTTGPKPDGLGWHADDERSHASDIILSITLTEQNGERCFEMRPKKATSGCTWSRELPHQSVLLMLPGCQDSFKHRVSDRKKNLAQKTITGGRINLTFRALKPSSAPTKPPHSALPLPKHFLPLPNPLPKNLPPLPKHFLPLPKEN